MLRGLRSWLIILVLAIVPMTVSAQGVDPATEPTAQIRFVHGLTDVQAVDIYLDGQLIVTALPLGGATEYGLTGTGTKLVSVLESTNDGSVGRSLLDKSLTLNTGLFYTLAMAGIDVQVDAFLFEDDIRANSQSEGSLRVVNLVPQQGGVAAAINDAALTSMINYGASSKRIKVDKSNTSPAVTILDQTGKPLFSTKPIYLGGGEFYTLFVINNGAGLQYVSINYPLTSGEVPASAIWLPLTSIAHNAAEEAMSAEEVALAEEAALAEEGASAEEEVPAEEGAPAEDSPVESGEGGEGHRSTDGTPPSDNEDQKSGSAQDHEGDGTGETDQAHGAEGEGQHDSESSTLEELLPVPLWMLVGSSLLVVLFLLGGSWLWWVIFHRK